MSDKEGIVLSSGTSSGREMRDKSRVNYAKLHSHGKGDRIEAADDFYESENVEELVSDKLGEKWYAALGSER